MAGNIKGITIEINGDTTKLEKALDGVDKSTKNVNGELKQVNSLLKFNPGNTELVAQKQELLAKQVQNTSDRLQTLKQAQSQVDAQFKSGDMGEEQYRAFQREIVATEGKLKNYQGQLESSKGEQKELETATKRLSSYFEASGKSVDDYADILGPKLTNAIKEGRASSTQLNDAINKIGRTATGSEDEFTQFSASLKKIDDGGSIDALKSDLSGLSEKSDQANESLDQIAQNTFSEKAQNIGDAFSDMGQGIQDFAEKTIDAWSETDDAVDNLTSKTGAVGAEADKLSESYEKVSTSLAGAQMDSSDLSDTMSGLKSTFGLSGKELQNTTEYVAKFSQVTGQTGSDAVDALRETLGKFNVSAKDIPSVLDAFTAASQNSGVSVDDLEQQVADAYPAFDQLGISLQDGVGIVGAWAKSGVDTQVVLKGMTKASTVYAAANVPLKKGITDTFNAIKNAKSPTDALNAGVEAFGTKAAPQMVAAIQDGKVNLDDLTKTATNTGGKVADTFNQTIDPIDKVKQKQKELQEQMGEVGGQILETVAPALEQFVKFVKNVVDGFLSLPGPIKQFIVIFGGVTVVLGILAPIIAAFVTMGSTVGLVAAGIAIAIAAIIAIIMNWGTIVDWLKGVWGGISTWFGEMWTNVTNIFHTAVDAISAWFKQTWQGIIDFFKGLWSGITDWFSQTWTGITNVFHIAVDGISSWFEQTWQGIIDWFKNLWNGMKDFISTVWDGIKLVFNTVIGLITSFIKAEINGWKLIITTVMNAIKLVFTTVWNAIKLVFTTIFNIISTVVKTFFSMLKTTTKLAMNDIKLVFSTVWNAIKTVVSTVVNAIKAVVTNVWNGIKSVTSNVWNGIKSTISGVVNGIKSTVSNVWNGLKSVTSNVWNGIKAAIMTPINAAKNAVKTAIDAIKRFFSFKISWPHIPLPHFSISGSLNPLKWLNGNTPKIGVKFYAAGGIMTKPTMFSGANGTAHVGGEAGNEAILPLTDKVLGTIGQSIFATMGYSQQAVVNRLDQVLAVMKLLLANKQELKVYLDTGKLVGSTADAMNKLFGKNIDMAGRGN